MTSLVCAVLLLRSFLARRTKLLLWISIGFAGFALQNALLFAEVLSESAVDLSTARNLTVLAASLVLVSGLVWETGREDGM